MSNKSPSAYVRNAQHELHSCQLLPSRGMTGNCCNIILLQQQYYFGPISLVVDDNILVSSIHEYYSNVGRGEQRVKVQRKCAFIRRCSVDE